MHSKIAVIIGGHLSPHFKEAVNHLPVYGSEDIAAAIKTSLELEAKGEAQAIVAPRLTAIELRKHLRIPVIHAEPSYFDLLDTLKYAEEHSGITDSKIALVIYRRDLQAARLQRFIKNKLFTYFYEYDSDIKTIIEEVKAQHIHLVVGGTTTLSLAADFGMHCYLARMGIETINTAVERAQDILSFDRRMTEQNERLRIVLNSVPDGVIVTDQHNLIKEFNVKASEIFKAKADKLMDYNVTNYLKNIELVRNPPKASRTDDLLIDINDSKFFINQKPIVVNRNNIGMIYLLQEVMHIEKLEHAYRKARTSGFTAKYTFANIIGESPQITQIVEKAKAFARVDSTILIEGETGTGKEIFAQSIHNFSQRQNGPFVALNCAAIPENLLESELFGYEAGAFTGARKGGHIGMFELAHNGTIFLDEINQIPLNLQARILRVLQEKQVMRIGGERIIPINVRIITSSNQNLRKLVIENKFREDLYYRLNILNLNLPALKNRKSDIPLLVKHFIGILVKSYNCKVSFSKDAIRLLSEYDWPGNIRELINFVERYVVIYSQLNLDGYAYTKDFIEQGKAYGQQMEAIVPGQGQITINIAPLEDMEKEIIEKILYMQNGNKKSVLDILKISRTTLWKKLK